ncbi:hypothetical protein CEV34_5326 [Brucella pseudogrignonensis]|uniref:Uncharacterized protein n=1 Tax=Brucella pseudogrignonensis TaxID=419475 RepID=A0A256G174_9HYPH|nr:hypothetical protein CEV34_5326 [Brucella pseudogrignonensis]
MVTAYLMARISCAYHRYFQSTTRAQIKKSITVSRKGQAILPC